MTKASAALTITEERTYRVQLAGRVVTGLAVASAWEGFTKYTNAAGAHLIVLDAEQRVVKGSPDLVDQLGLAAAGPILPFAIGDHVGGGYFTGIITVDGQRYALITAGAEGELRGAWHASASRIEGAVSRRDGKVNTLDMEAAGSALAKQAAALNIGGLTDWYIPSRDELELVYRAFKPTKQSNYADGEDGVNPNSLPSGLAYTEDFPVQSTIESFRAGGADALADSWYWSSTQHASSPSFAWIQFFGIGYQLNGHKSYEGRARAVRRLPI